MTLLRILLVTLVPVAAAAIAAAVAAVRPPGGQLRSAIQHFAAGVVFSVVAVELLPEVVAVHDLVEIGWTFAAGVMCMFGVSRLAGRLGGGEHEGASPGALTGIAIDVLIDGLLLGIAFAAGARQGLLLTAALTLELLSLSVAIAAGIAAAGAGRTRAVLVPTGIALLLVVGAVVGDVVLRDASPHTMAGVLAFGSAALLYLVTEELLVEAHECPDTPFATLMFFAGFLIFLLLGMA